ncbi:MULTISPECIES: K+/H+ antiporter subunit F [Oceanospirillaceae]|jgi:multicomponent K+:H+ antiporter subunit F|uniref:K+/H+ antiporter subunit F n=1 Tax=Oceanospirillaceae TaxID=135620 RepID=UPI000C3FCC1C|nr:K+/H+ antiporter subunit F [Thalassolituus sp. ST750PaO-4]MCB2386273.1 K+/H+ antiporter subunit F [Thalassolituus alkanivorans]PIQ40925.1 MAG: K+/H+ antiporter subunit F [Thalassolituus sp. CG17_big_fil_post_rev_8_21_14_2_50_53_8]TVV41894.1 K+/H+ antiporter subunit F [Thalassolituus sp. C2-1]MCA6060568.1 K+/H+ antiporter subunit F [Thalassolituus sp. ST750PaO-4]MCB2424296.1 K+/H+ antiporter subunit F [Thalassolituus alkanivorans]|tara:strand:+ start:91 stop:375 length:285 start_codon:yes stop_codon:yes gene_type:complete
MLSLTILQGAVLLTSTLVVVALILNIWRMLRGPDITDRILALDTLYINSIALIILLGLYNGSALYFEGALLIAMLGFVSTAALCKYLLRGDIIE